MVHFGPHFQQCFAIFGSCKTVWAIFEAKNEYNEELNFFDTEVFKFAAKLVNATNSNRQNTFSGTMNRY